jgi:hypothetical protein
MAVVRQLGKKPKEAIMTIPLIGAPDFESPFDWEEKGPTPRQPLNDRWPSVCSEIHTSRFAPNSVGPENGRD